MGDSFIEIHCVLLYIEINDVRMFIKVYGGVVKVLPRKFLVYIFSTECYRPPET